MTAPSDLCPCESGRAFANCHGAEESRDRAWARLVRAAIDERDATFADELDQSGAPEWLTRTRAEYEAALGALRDLGVDVDGMMEDR